MINQIVIKQLIISLFLTVISLQLHAKKVTIAVESKDNLLLLETDTQNRLRTIYFGKPLFDKEEYSNISTHYNYSDNNIGICNSAYTPSGTWSLSESAIALTHADGNSSLELNYVSHTVTEIDSNVKLISILQKDPQYPVEVTLYYKVFFQENLIEQWSEIEHHESKSIRLQRYSSANLYFTDNDFYLTTFHNQWAKEMQPNEAKLSRGIRTINSKLGARAMLLQSPSFILSFDQPAAEDNGTVVLGHLAWSGNFNLDFEIDSYDNLRVLGGINPDGSDYMLNPNQVFKTPSLIYAVSHNGAGEASRNIHQWARDNRVLDGDGERLTLLNNWEATYFDFDEDKITSLFSDAKDLGVDLFLLDDGWFGNKYPRNDSNAGLGDWQENRAKLPHGIGHLVKEAHKEGIKFGIWIEPEMVNPKSELYENHKDWVIRQPERPEVYFRGQLVLDLSNPDVQDFVYGVVDNLFSENPELAFIKWDCNSVIYNAHSIYLEDNGIPQSHIYIEYVKGLYKILERVRAKYPKVPMMLCSGGGGRADYELLKYFTEFWPSDDTDPLERVYMQWNYSYFFPSITTDCHVTNWGKQGIKYKVDVASMGKLGFDIVADELTPSDLLFCKRAVENYHSFKDLVWHGDLYRLVNPYKDDIGSISFVDRDKEDIIMFNYLVNNRVDPHTSIAPVKLKGLDPKASYSVKEINLYPGRKTKFDSDRVYSGDFLMKVGVNVGVTGKNPSVVLRFRKI